MLIWAKIVDDFKCVWNGKLVKNVEMTYGWYKKLVIVTFNTHPGLYGDIKSLSSIF